ncbi:hypothetical protein jhhlp_001642 [Lomentospora prolificans]|uniref:Galactose oxidase n=1 Tax=Lomentospora prolificans TaxID=41688 RepID=A0A2N3NJ07_9PEZI|nr:hypothetical protein jhhlp_001642 [Lomentospora prolificans]
MVVLKLLFLAVASFTASASAQTWEPLASVPVGGTLQEHTTVVLTDSLLAVVGGLVEGGTTTDTVLLYNITADSWSQAAPLPIPLNHPNAIGIDGRIYVLGGLSGESGWPAVPNTFAYDLETGEWEELQGLPKGLQRGSCIVGTYDNKIYLAGGIPGARTSMVDVSIFDLEDGEWITVPEAASKIPAPRDHGGGAIINGKMYVIGGRNSGLENVRDTVFILDLEDLEAGWTTSEARMPTARGGISVAAIEERIYVFGGEGNAEEGTNGVFNNVEVYDVEKDEWEALEPMDLPRHGTSAAAVWDRIYIPGGGIVQGVGATDVFDVYIP